MERQLPIFTIERTDFLVDVSKQELREKNNPANTISFMEMEDHTTHYSMRYDPDVKNFPERFGKRVDEISIPTMVQLDPEGMAAHHGLSLEEAKKKTDFEMVVNQELIQLRENGVLPMIDIAGHPFYVDLRMDCLRPKDDFSTMGISFSEIDFYLLEDEKVYQIPYNPATREFADLDLQKITEFPKDLIMVEIPYKSIIDPIGYSRWLGIESKNILRRYPPVAEMKAKVQPWEKTEMAAVIKHNREKLKQTERQQPRRKKGKRL